MSCKTNLVQKMLEPDLGTEHRKRDQVQLCHRMNITIVPTSKIWCKEQTVNRCKAVRPEAGVEYAPSSPRIAFGNTSESTLR